MNRNLLIVGVGVLLILAVGTVVAYVSRPASTFPTSPNFGTSGNVLPDSAYTSGTGRHGSAPSSGKPSTGTSTAPVLSEFDLGLSTGNPDNIKPGRAVVVGGYALVEWKGNYSAGEALFKYDASGKQWVEVDPGGGQWSVAAIMKFGVDGKTALALLSQLHNPKN